MPIKSLSRAARILLAVAVVFAVGAAVAPLAAKSSEPQIGDNEVKMGDDAARDTAKSVKLINNAAELKRVNDIGQKIAAIANREVYPALYGSSKVTPFKYTFSIVDDKDVNAFSLPGGHIYVNQGLLDFVQSDQELAAFLATKLPTPLITTWSILLVKELETDKAMAAAMLAALLGGTVGKANAADMSNIVMAVRLVQIAKLSGYGVTAERDADHGGIHFMKEAGYNPVGMLQIHGKVGQTPTVPWTMASCKTTPLTMTVSAPPGPPSTKWACRSIGARPRKQSARSSRPKPSTGLRLPK